MSSVGVVVVVVVAIFAASMLGAWLRGGGSQSDSKGVRDEMQRILATQAQGFSSQMGQVTQLLTQELSEMRREMDQGVNTAGQISAEAQRDITLQLRDSNEALARLAEQMEGMRQSGQQPTGGPIDAKAQREVTKQLRESNEALARLAEQLEGVRQSGQQLTEAAQTMHAAVGGPTSRGVVGEAQLQDLLGDVLPGSSYEMDHRFSNGATAVALHAGRKLVAIDANFPFDSYRNVVEQGEDAQEEFAQAVREHVDEVSESFVLPEEGTLDIALMFVPSEGAFVELLRTGDEEGRLEEYCRQKHVLPVSPNSLHAYLGAVLIGLRGMEFEENARRMLAGLEGVKNQFEQFGQAHAELGSRLQETHDAYEEAGRQLAQTRAALEAATPAKESAEGSAQESVETETAVAEEPVSVNASNDGDIEDEDIDES